MSYQGGKKVWKCFYSPIYNVIFIIIVASTTSSSTPDLVKANTLASLSLSGVNTGYQAHS